MKHTVMSIQGKLKSTINFTRSFLKKPEEINSEGRDFFISSGKDKKEWTVLIYGEGKNRLAYSTNAALNKMEKIGSNKDVNIVVQATVSPTWKERFSPEMGRVNTRRYYISKDNNEEKITSPIVEDLGEKVPLNADTLSDFLSWGIKEFPAKHYMVVIKKHGSGFMKTHHEPLSAAELGEALEKTEAKTGKTVDILSFDSCSMSQMEVGYEIKEQVNVMAGSQEDIYAIDYPYERILSGLQEKAGVITAREVGELVVKSHEIDVPAGTQTAIDLEKLKNIGIATKDLVETLIKKGIKREIIYTDMLKTSSMEPVESRRLAFDFRDERGFLKNLMEDKNITSEEIKEKAKMLDDMLSDAVIAHYIWDTKKKIKDGRGLNLYIPWKNPSKDIRKEYDSLKFEKDSTWMKLIDYIFEDKHVLEDFGNGIKASDEKNKTEKLSLSQKLGKEIIHNYKKYVAPYHMSVCRHTPSCSQYGREAIEKHGLIQGSKMAFMRILGCTPEATAKYDPVPDLPPEGEEVKCNIEYREIPPDFKDNNLPEILVSPPKKEEKSPLRKYLENHIISAGALTGKILGGITGALVSLPVGTAMGAILGTKSGRDEITDFNRKLLSKYHRDSVKEFTNIERFVGTPGYKVHEKVKEFTGAFTITEDTLKKSGIEMLNSTSAGTLINKRFSEKKLREELSGLKFNEGDIDVIINNASYSYNETLAKVLGGSAGAITGTLIGAIGGSATGFRWGAKMSGLFAKNYLKEKFGELAIKIETEQILKYYYE